LTARRQSGQSEGREGEEKKNRLLADLFLDVDPLHPDHTSEDGDDDKRVVIHELASGERAEGVHEKASSLLEVSDGEEVKALVDLESVPSIPVTAFVDQSDSSVQASKRERGKGRISLPAATHVGRGRKSDKGKVGGNELGSYGKVGGDDGVVVEEEADPDDGEDDVDPRSEPRSLGQSQVESGQTSRLHDETRRDMYVSLQFHRANVDGRSGRGGRI
jgi:hypothetical protein